MIEGLGSARENREKSCNKTPKAALKSIKLGTADLDDVLIIFEEQERREQ